MKIHLKEEEFNRLQIKPLCVGTLKSFIEYHGNDIFNLNFRNPEERIEVRIDNITQNPETGSYELDIVI